MPSMLKSGIFGRESPRVARIVDMDNGMVDDPLVAWPNFDGTDVTGRRKRHSHDELPPHVGAIGCQSVGVRHIHDQVRRAVERSLGQRWQVGRIAFDAALGDPVLDRGNLLVA